MKDIDEIRKKTESSNEKKGSINSYTCKSCNNTLCTVLLENGVTPFMIKCKKCGSTMQSNFYKPSNNNPTMEWWRPESKEELLKEMRVEIIIHAKSLLASGLDKYESFKIAKEAQIDHWQSGGLFLRDIKRT